MKPVWGSDQNSFACSPGGLISLISIKLIAVAAASSICNRTAGFRVSYGRHRLCPARSGCPQPSQTWRRYPAQVPHVESGVFSSSSSVRSSRNHNPAWMRRRGSSHMAGRQCLRVRRSITAIASLAVRGAVSAFLPAEKPPVHAPIGFQPAAMQRAAQHQGQLPCKQYGLVCRVVQTERAGAMYRLAGQPARQLVMDRVLRRSFGSSTESWNA